MVFLSNSKLKTLIRAQEGGVNFELDIYKDTVLKYSSVALKCSNLWM